MLSRKSLKETGFTVELRRAARNRGCLFTLLIVLISQWATAQNYDVAAIIQKSVEANDRDWNAAPQYDCVERDRDEHGTKTYQVTTILGSPYERLIAINGRDLSASEKAKEEKKFQEMLSHRRAETPEERAKRISKFEADRRRDHEMLQQLTKAFDFTLQGEQQVGQRAAYVLKATPHPGYKPPNRDTQVLPGMQGRLWIDKKTFQWIRVEAHVVHPVSIEGFLAEVEPGTHFELEKMPVDNDIWLAKHFAMKASAKVLRFIPHHDEEEQTYSNYRKSETASNSSELSSPASSSQLRQYADSRPANR